MSAQSAKKKRFGSRRRVANQNEISKADEFHVADSTLVAERHIPEEHTESLNVLAHLDNSQSDTQHPASPELSGNRRKLGSSRRNKGRHVKDSATESYHEHREEVGDRTREKETTITKQTAYAIQSERQEALSQHSGFLYSASTPDSSPEVQNATTINCSEANLESLIPKDGNLQTDVDENETNFEVVSDTCKLVETTQEGTDKSILHNAEVGISELTSLSALSCPTVDQQLIDQSNFKEMPEQKLPNVGSVMEKEDKKRDTTELFRQGGNLQNNCLVGESHVESVVMPFSTMLETTTENISPAENTEVECSVGQTTVSSPKNVLPTDEEQNEHFNLSEVRKAHHPEDAVNKQECRLTEMPQIDNSSESVIHEATGNSEMISGNLTDQSEVSDTNQSEKSSDGSPIIQDISNPDNKQDEHPTDENSVEALEQKNEDDHVYDSKEPQIIDIETVDTELGQVHETEGRVEDDIKPSAEQTANQEKDRRFSEEEESESSLQTVQSEIKASLDSQLQQNDTSFSPIGSRRKLGSSRRNRGRHHVKDSADESRQEQNEDVESTRGNEALETAQMLLATERTSPEELCQGSEHDIKPATHDSSLYSATMTDYSSEVQSPTTTKNPEADLESLVPESENLQEDHDERETHFRVEESDESVGATLEGSDKSDTLQSQEVKGEHHSEDAVNIEYEQEVKTTENQEMPQIDNSSESVIHEATENSEMISGNLTDQTEVSDTNKSELTEGSPDGSPIIQDISNPDNKQDEHPKGENSVEALEQKNEDDHVYDSKEPQIIDRETVDTELGQVHETEGRVEDDIKPSAEQTANQEKERRFSEEEESESSLQIVQSEIKASLDSQLQQNDTSFSPIGSRRKLGSSRRNRGRQHVKDSADESHQEHKDDVESTRGNEALETAQMLLATERMSPEKLSQGSEHDIKPATHDSSLYSATMTDYSSEVQSPTTTTNPEADLESLVPESENLQEDHDERETHFKVEESDESVGATLEGSDKSDTLQSQEVKGEHHSEDAVNIEYEQEVKTTENQEMPQIDNSSESVIHEATENSEMISGNLIDQSEVSDANQSEESPDGSPIIQDISNPDNKQDEHPTDENSVEALEQKNEDDHVYDSKEPQIIDIETVDTALGQVHETEGRVEDDIKPSAEQTANQEKERRFSEEEESESSLQTVQSEIKASLDSQLQQNDTSFSPIGSRRKLGSSRRNRGRQHVKDSADESRQEQNEDVESTRGNEAFETAQMLLATERTSPEELSQGSEHDIKPATHDNSLYSATMTDYSSEVQSPTTTKNPEADLESLVSESENLPENHDERETHFKVEESDESVGATLEGSDKSDTLQSQEVKGEHHSEDAVNIEYEQEVKTTENQEMPQIDNSSESVIHEATENSEMISGNLTDQTEVSDTNKSELTEGSPDGSPIIQDISNPNNKQEEHPTGENSVEALEQKNEDDHVYDSKEPQIIDIETVDTALGQVHETEGRVEDDIKPSAEQTAHQEKERLFSEEEESESSLQTVQSEIKASLDSQLQQNDTSFSPIGSRRKLGSSRRNRGRHHVKDSADESHQEHKDDVESTRGNEALETAQMLLATERTSPEELSQGSEHDIKPATHDNSLYSATMTDYSSEVQSPTTTKNPEADLESLVPESENLQEDHDERETHFKVEESDESVGATLEGSDRSDTLQSQEVKGEHHSEDAVNIEYEQEVKTTENQEMPQIDNSSESVIHEATENSEMISGNLTDQTEVSDTNQSEESPDGSLIIQDISNPDNKQDEHPTDENSVEALEQKNEDDHVYDSKEPQIIDIETVDTALGQVHETEGRVEDDIKPSAEQTANQEKERLFSEEEESESSLQTVQSEIKASLDSQLQQNDTSFKPSGSRRKLGSSRRNRGRHHVKDSADESYQSKEDVVGNIRDNEPLETTEMSSIETVLQEKIMETMLEGMDTFDTPQTEDVKDNIGTQEMDEDTQSFRQDGNLQTNYLVSESHAKSEDIEPSITLEVSSENNSPGEHTQVECSVEQAAISSSTEELSTNEEQKEYVSLGASDDSINKAHEEVIQPTQMQEMPQIDNSSIEDSESSSQTLQSENLYFQHLDNSIKDQTHTGFSSAGNRRKLGSSRRRKGRLHVEDTTSSVMETMGQEELKEQTDPDSKFAGEIGSTVNNEENPDKMSKEKVNMQHTNETPETAGDVMKQDYITGAESSINAQVYKLDEDGEQFEDPTKKDHEAHEMDVSPDITQRFSAAQNKTESLAPFDMGLKEDIQTESAVDVSEESQQGTQKQTNSDNGENLQGRSQQKRRKLGSTRRTQLKKKIEETKVETKDLNTEADTRSLDKMEAVEELTVTVTAEVSQNKNAKPSLSPLDKEEQEIISKAFFPEQSASHNIELIQPIIKLGNTIESMQRENEKRPEIMTQDPAMKSAEAPVVADLEIVKSAASGGAAEEQTSAQASVQEPDDMNEGAHNKHLKIKNTSPNLDSTTRRRKMGSSRRSLGPRTKQEDLHQKQEVDDKATEAETNVGDVKKENFSGIAEDELQLHTEHKDSEQREEKGSETMAYSHTDEEDPVSHGQLVETEHRLTPTYLPSTPSTSPKHDSSSPGGRRRKMGSHRKSRGHQNHENQTARGDKLTDDERDVRSITDESATKMTGELRETSLGLDKISEVNKSGQKPSTNISTAKEGDLWRPVSEKTPGPVTPGQHPYAEIKLGQESEHKFSLAGDSREADCRPKAYNVMMIGDSCVGKTSFMKRAYSGKFSLDLPASVGLDSCMWTVVVDGKPVVLQLWDTAGQERFHSITRQIFHKAHAFLLMYDITSSKTFSAVSYWASCIQEGAAEDVTILLVGNKSDHAERQVNTQEAEVLAKEYNFEFMECSAATGENVVQCLETVARMLSQKVDIREEAMVLHKDTKQRKSGCC